METSVIPAIIARTQVELDNLLNRVIGKVGRVQLDVMDGEFVANTSLWFDFRLPNGMEYEAHLMAKKPLEWVKENISKVDTVILHAESLEDIGLSIDQVKSKGFKVYLSLKPETKIDYVLPYLDNVDGIQIMTVNPGKYGGEFLPETLEKIRRIRQIRKDINIEVDGSMNPKNAALAKHFGANIFVSGSYILASNDVDKAIKELEEAVTNSVHLFGG
jgi:ribulose-phosphate 3-epimerase